MEVQDGARVGLVFCVVGVGEEGCHCWLCVCVDCFHNRCDVVEVMGVAVLAMVAVDCGDV